MELKGRQKVVIPISREDFFNDIKGSLENHIGTAVKIHNQNIGEIDYIHKQYLGLQDLLTEKKRYDSSEINNLVVENHLNKQVNFKVGFMYGNPIEYTITNEKKIETDDLGYLNTYFNDVSKASLDIEKAQDLYEYGIAYQRIIPKRFEIEDYKSESPFELVNMPIDKTCVVYSNDIPNEELFSLVISSKVINGKERKIYQIFMPYHKYEYDTELKEIVVDKAQPFKFNPIVEFCLNKDRIGIIELVLSLQNLVNKIDSLQIDDIEESINSFMVLFNQKLDDDFIAKFKDLKKQRVLVLNTNNPQIPADMKILSNELKQEAVNIFYERVVKAMYDIVAVPQASGNVTSGGDTGQARLLGNGWESAQNQAQIDQTYLTQYERLLLKNVLRICRDTANCPINELFASDVAIKFNINMSNNLLVKSESMQLLDSIGLPKKAILNICGITKDIDGLGDSWEKNIEKIKNQEIELEKAKTNQTQNNDNKNLNE